MVIKALNDIWIALRAFDEQALTVASGATLIYIGCHYCQCSTQIAWKKQDFFTYLFAENLHFCCVYGLYVIPYISYIVGKRSGEPDEQSEFDSVWYI